MADKIFLNPLTDIKISDLPVVVFFESCRSLIALAIRIRTGGEKNHVAIMVSTDKVASQGFTGYKEYPIKKFMKVGEELKFISLADVATDEEKAAIAAKVEGDLNLKGIKGFFKNGYDFLGIVGQLLGLKFINNPWKNFCSERIAIYCKMIEKIKALITYKPSPEELNEIFKKIPAIRLLGYWIND